MVNYWYSKYWADVFNERSEHTAKAGWTIKSIHWNVSDGGRTEMHVLWERKSDSE